MTYDYIYSGYMPTDPVDKTMATMDHWINSGLPAPKMNMGMPFYGRDCSLGSSNCIAISWYEYYQQSLTKTWTWPKQPYFLDEEGRVQKANYINVLNLAGVHYWNVDQDIPLTDASFPMPGSTLVTKRYAALWDELLESYGR